MILDDKLIEELNYNFTGMEDGWLEPTYELQQLYNALIKYKRSKINEKSNCNSRSKRGWKKYFIK